MTPYGWADT